MPAEHVSALEADVAGGAAPLIGCHDEERGEASGASGPTKGNGNPGRRPGEEDVSLLEENELLKKRLELLERENSQMIKRLQSQNRGWRLPGSSEGMCKLRHAPRDLFIVFFAKWAECTAYFGFSYIFVAFVSEEFGMTDKEAGALYAWYGLLCTLFGLIGGFCIDNLGVRKSLIFGTSMATIARGICFLTTDKEIMKFAILVFAPLGAAFGVPVMAISVRRYTHTENRAYAFSYFYGVLNLGCICGVYLINSVRWNWSSGMVVAGAERSWMRLVVGVSTLFTACTVVAAFFVRDVRVDSERPLTDAAVQKFQQAPCKLRDRLKECAGTSRFWRLTLVTFIFCGVRMTFRHLDATFPKYFMRQYGKDSPFEMILLVNPVLTMMLCAPITELLVKWNVRLPRILIGGSLISGMSAFSLAAEDSPSAAVLFVVLLSVGESIWSPKLYEYSTMAAPDGREGMYVALTFAPVYLASFFTGFLSGWLLENFCSKHHPETRNTQMLWFIVAMAGLASPLALLVLRKCLFRSEDESDGAPGSSARSVKISGSDAIVDGEERPRGHTQLPENAADANSDEAE